jgi:hypothetical protein
MSAQLYRLEEPGLAPSREEGWVCRHRVHDLRRLAATTLVIEGVDVKTAPSRLGHSDPRVTLAIYASASSRADEEAAVRLERRFFGNQSSSGVVTESECSSGSCSDRR